ncbi:MAG: GNAT family N-acetyltransferase [Salibacteraceae bacterium]
MNIEIKHWNSLTKEELYQILQLRTEVFVVEQNCAYQECDGKDLVSYHLIGKIDNQIIATARIIPNDGEEVYLGRIVVSETFRKHDFGKRVVRSCIDFAKKNLKANKVSMSAQTYLNGFYKNLGFKTVGEEYLEDDIPHIHMEQLI